MKQYYYSDGLSKHGPYSLEELRSRNLSRNTMVWHDPMDKWLPAESFPELQDLFHDKPPVFQSPGTPEKLLQQDSIFHIIKCPAPGW